MIAFDFYRRRRLVLCKGPSSIVSAGWSILQHNEENHRYFFVFVFLLLFVCFQTFNTVSCCLLSWYIFPFCNIKTFVIIRLLVHCLVRLRNQIMAGSFNILQITMHLHLKLVTRMNNISKSTGKIEKQEKAMACSYYAFKHLLNREFIFLVCFLLGILYRVSVCVWSGWLSLFFVFLRLLSKRKATPALV